METLYTQKRKRAKWRYATDEERKQARKKSRSAWDIKRVSIGSAWEDWEAQKKRCGFGKHAHSNFAHHLLAMHNGKCGVSEAEVNQQMKSDFFDILKSNYGISSRSTAEVQITSESRPRNGEQPETTLHSDQSSTAETSGEGNLDYSIDEATESPRTELNIKDEPHAPQLPGLIDIQCPNISSMLIPNINNPSTSTFRPLMPSHMAPVGVHNLNYTNSSNPFASPGFIKERVMTDLLGNIVHETVQGGKGSVDNFQTPAAHSGPKVYEPPIDRHGGTSSSGMMNENRALGMMPPGACHGMQPNDDFCRYTFMGIKSEPQDNNQKELPTEQDGLLSDVSSGLDEKEMKISDETYVNVEETYKQTKEQIQTAITGSGSGAGEQRETIGNLPDEKVDTKRRNDKQNVKSSVRKRQIRQPSQRTTAALRISQISTYDYEAAGSSADTESKRVSAPVGSMSYWCIKCEVPLGQLELKEHLNHHLKGHEDQCTECNAGFVSEARQSEHLLKLMGNLVKRVQLRFKCPECDYKTRCRCVLNRHVAMNHKAIAPFMCYHCEAGFKSKGSLGRHSAFHSRDKPYTCEYCEKILQKEAEPLNWCPLCHIDLGHEADLSKHNEELHKRTFLCDDCGAQFECHSSLKEHAFKHTGNWPFTCETCGMGFARITAYNQHVATHSQDYPYVCDECGKCFKIKAYLNHHKQEHLENTSYDCPECGKHLTNTSQVRKHKYMHKVNHETHRCQECGLVLKGRGGYLKHMRNHEGLVKRNHACDQCSKTFKSQNAYKRHALTHTSVRPHVCDVCGDAFRQKGHLKTHMMKHTGDWSHKCPLCDKGFGNPGHLNKHLQSAHGQSSCAMVQ